MRRLDRARRALLADRAALTGAARRAVPLWGALAAVGLGAFVRVAPVRAVGFPLNDGGLFYLMTRELQAAGYALPAFTSYNAAGIPFAYPPLGLYLAAGAAGVTGRPLVDVVRLLPAAFSVATIGAFFLLARSLLRSPSRASIATVAFALLPRSFVWFVMGGGLTRAPGFLFTLLMLHQAHAMYTTGERRHVATTALLAALAVATHLESAWFGAYSAGVLFVAYGRHRRGLLHSALVAAGTLVLTAPWWGVVVARHGHGPFANAIAGAGPDAGLSAWGAIRWFDFTDEPHLSLLGVLGLVGGFLALGEGKPLAVAWLATIFVLNPRNPATPATVPLAMLIGIAVDRLIATGRAPDTRPADATAPRHSPRVAAALPRVAAAAMLAYLASYAAVSARGATRHNRLTAELPAAQRAAMRWVADSTPPASAFIAMSYTSGWFGADQTSEWFPALAGRADLVTVQGYEWLPGGQFASRIGRFFEALACGESDVACLEAWAARGARDFTHVFVPAEGRCAPLIASLRSSPRYRPVYERDGVLIFERRR